MIDKKIMKGGVSNNVLNKYMPITINLQTPIKNIFDVKYDINLNTNIDFPKFSLGFVHYYHSLQKDMTVLKQFENKKKVYQIINEFETNIDNYDNSIQIETNKFLKLDKNSLITDTNFYKLWEMLFMFDLINTNNPINTLNIDDEGGFLNAQVLFRDKYTKSSDKYFVIKNNTNTQNINNLIGNNKNKSIKLIDEKDVKDVKENMDLIIADSNIKIELQESLEQEYYKILFKNILIAVKVQKREGVFICKFFETYTLTSIKFILILMSIYDKVFFSKPLTSKLSDPEKYIVCVGFKYSNSDKKLQEILKGLEKLYDDAVKSKYNIVDIFTTYEPTKEFLMRILQMNLVLGNNQFKQAGDIVSFINSQNYYGDTYQNYRDKQIEAAEYWTKIFLPDEKEFKQNKNKIIEISFLSNKINTDAAIKLEKTII
jgi:hypothetical protein